jgi:hypothetical protein
VGSCHHGIVHPRVADGGDALHIWRVAGNIFNKQSRTAEKRRSSSLGVGRGANKSSPYKEHLVSKCYTELLTCQVLVNTVMNLRVP